MNIFSNIEIWRSSFGLLPIKINPINSIGKFLMLNGGNGDFCLQTSANKNSEDIYYSESWSTNTKNFVVVETEKVKIFNWLNKNKEVINVNDIKGNEEKFYKYLVSKSYKTENDVVPFIVNIFRQLRNYTKEKNNPAKAINLLYQLLISLDEDYTNIDYQKWNIENQDLPPEFEDAAVRIKKGVKGISNHLDLILRHSSGALFQEAHREVVYFDQQLNFFTGFSNKLSTKKDAYSSIHYTPQYLARSIVENSIKNLDLKKLELKIFDPACGSSEFLIEALKQLKNLGYNGKLTVVGWDTSESAINTSKFLLQYENRTQWNSSLKLEVEKVEDSLSEKWDFDFDLILMNPPFVSWELLKDKKSKDSLVCAFGENLKIVKPNQASAFFYKAVLALNNNGVIGCVLPSTIFTSQSYKNLRTEISEQLSLKLLAKLGNFVFEDALTDVSFFIGQKPKSSYMPKLLWSKNEKGIIQDTLRDFRKMEANNELSLQNKNFSIYTPTLFPIIPETWRIIPLEQNKLINVLDRFVIDGLLTPVGNVFTTNQGAILGIKNIFKISYEDYLNYDKINKAYFRPVLTNNSIKNGQLNIAEYLWYPYDKNGILLKNENDLNNIPFALNNLFPDKISLQNRKGINEWWGLTRPRNWQFVKNIRLYSTRFGNSHSFAFDKEGNCVIEEGNAFIPKKEFKTDDYYFYLAIFSSNFFDTLLSIYSKQLAGGKWYDLGAKYTSNIPIPNVHQTVVREHFAYTKLVEFGKELSSGNSYIKEVIDDVLKKSFYPMIP
ncbi:MAG: SAM-dependent DNA methyltransferase [Sphingobacteriales bacterium]|nr:MAG: SAM-dependent DNA methyltransferase [Sphingobacteriales bacterium]